MNIDTFWHKTLARPYLLHTVRYGVERTKKPVIVLLHGLATSGEDWADFIPLLAPKYEVITIDLLGFGSSPKPEWCNYTIDDHIRSITHTIRTLHIGKKYILAGHSLGSLLASRYAREHPAHIQRLLLLSPPVYPPLEGIEQGYSKRLTGILLALYKFLRTSPYMNPENFAKLARIAPLPRGVIADATTWVPFMRTLQHCIEQQTILQDVAQLAMPIDVFYGRLDQVVVNSNVELLGSNTHVSLHLFNGNHDLTKKYARLVADSLADNN